MIMENTFNEEELPRNTTEDTNEDPETEDTSFEEEDEENFDEEDDFDEEADDETEETDEAWSPAKLLINGPVFTGLLLFNYHPYYVTLST